MIIRQYLVLSIMLLCPLPAAAMINVFACEPEWAALTMAIAPTGKVDVFSATTANQNPHHIQARPSLIAKARRADLLICSGSELEIGWLPLLLRKSGNPKIQAGKPHHFMASEHVERLGMLEQVDRNMGDVHASGNPHVQFDPVRMATIAEKFSQRLITLLPDDADVIESNTQKLTSALHTLTAKIETRLANVDLDKLTIVAQHDNWIYLSDQFGIPIDTFIEPKPGVAPSTGHLTQLVDKLKTKDRVIILSAIYLDEKPVRWLSKKVDAEVIRLSLSPEKTDQKDSLILWYQHWTETLLAQVGNE